MEKLYVLGLKNGKYYVGKTVDFEKRYKQHLNGSASVWTSIHKPNKIIELRPLKDENDETTTTKEMMKKYGIENVRGGAFTQVELPDFVEQTLELEIRSSKDTCFNCGEAGHFAKDCDVEYVWECGYCPRQFASKSDCERHETKCGGQLSYSKSAGACYRCGRTSHYADNCFASTHIKGYKLD